MMVLKHRERMMPTIHTTLFYMPWASNNLQKPWKMAATPQNLDDYSPSSTIISLDRPIPLLRGPVRAGSSDDPSKGPYVLVFKDPQTFHAAHKSCASQIIQQCEGGARIGCAISASNNCKPPWWRALIGRNSVNFAEKAECEEREMAGCVALANEKCVEFAKEKCLGPFRDARVAMNVRKVNWKEVSKLIGWASAADKGLMVGLIGVEEMGTWCLSKCVNEITNCRGCELFGSDTKSERLINGKKLWN